MTLLLGKRAKLSFAMDLNFFFSFLLLDDITQRSNMLQKHIVTC